MSKAHLRDSLRELGNTFLYSKKRNPYCHEIAAGLQSDAQSDR